jgi:hypothetical protein
LLQLLGLYSLLLALPLLDVLGRHPDFFVARRSQPVDVVVLAAAVIALPPLVLWGLERTFGLLGLRARRLAHLVLCGGLAAAGAFVALRETTPLPEIGTGTIAVAAGAGFGLALGRFERLAAFTGWLAAFAPLLLLHFVALSPASSVVNPAISSLPEHDVRAPGIPIVMLVLDELPLLSMLDAEDRIDASRLPHFARFAETATWFRNATTTGDQTVIAVPSILTGRRAGGRTPADFGHHPESLFTLLAPSHRIRASESVTRLCPADLCREGIAPFGRRMRDLFSDAPLVALHVWLPGAWTQDLPAIDQRWTAFGGDPDSLSPNDSFEWFTTGLRSGGARFDYLHVLSPHGPWEHLPSGQRYGPAEALRSPEGLENTRWSDDPSFGRRALERHLLELANVDRLFGELMAALEARDLFDAALIVVVADHGVSFEPGEPWRSVTAGNRVELMSVPFMLKAPEQHSARVIDRNVETIDVLPTIADVLDIRIPWSVEGASALDHERPDHPTKQIESWQRSETHTVDDFPAARLDALHARLVRMQRRRDEAVGHPLVGARTDERTLFDATVDVRLDDPDAFEAVDLDSDYVPLFVSGSVSRERRGDPGNAPALAIAVDGRVRTVATAYRSGEEWRFSAILPLDSLRPGRNSIEVLAVATNDP